jgi:hypothetical protein
MLRFNSAAGDGDIWEYRFGIIDFNLEPSLIIMPWMVKW